MANDEQANLIVSAVNEATATLNDIQKSFESFEGSAQSLGVTSVALGGILKDVVMRAFSELKDMVRLGINEAIDAEQQQVKLAHAFKTEGDAAAGSIKAINDTANSLGALIGVDNDVIVASAATIRQLTGMSGEVISKVLPAIGDLATMTGSYESAAMLVTRAINGQQMGLSRLGINLDLTNDKTKNLDIVMAGLNERFGGQAQANMATTGGKLQNLKVIFTDVAQNIGEGILKSEAFNGALKLTKDTIEGIKRVLDNKPIDKAYSNDSLGRQNKFNDLLKDQIFAINALNKVIKEKKDLEKEDPSLLGNYQAINAEIEKKSAIVRKTQDDLVKFNEEELIRNKKLKQDYINASNIKKELSIEELENTLKKEQASFDAEQEASTARIAIATEEAEKKEFMRNFLSEQEQRLRDETNSKWTDDQILAVQNVNDIMIFGSIATAEMIRSIYADMSSGLSNILLGTFGNLSNTLYSNFLNSTKSGLDKAKEFWIGFTMNIISLINQILVKMALIRIGAAIVQAATPGGFFASFGKALASLQTPEGSSRLIPGPPNMPQLVVAHGGETIGRGGQSSGDTIVIQGDYFESEEANARLFDRVRTYKKRSGVEL